ncbi:MAG TPA: type II secretion system F family protein [Micromonosporaceae bacterium]|nr:type II secretion system F family protein [Micromonosporaceae bacterium]
MISLIALLSAVLSLSGVVVGVVGVVGTTRPRGPDSAVRRAIKWLWSGHGHRRVDQWTRRTTLVVGLLAGASTWLLSGWPVAGLLVGIAVPGIPWLFLAGTAERRAIERLAAIESWTRRVADIVANGLGLQAAIVATATTAPAKIEHEVRGLAADLQAGTSAEYALRRFADEIDDYTCDQVVAPLVLHAGDRGEGLASVLTDLSRSIAAEVEMRRTVDAKRAGPRFAVRFLTGMTVAVLVFFVVNPQYLAPYGTAFGQLLLLVLAAIYTGLMIWVRNLSVPSRRERLLAPLPALAQAAGVVPR